MSANSELIDRFTSKINKENDCWIWKAQIYPTGYGNFWMKRKNKLSHRASWEIFKGEIPEGLCVCHKCDNRSCVNPEHLFLGSHKDNTQDMINKNRKHLPKRLLDANQEIQALEMYKNGISQRRIAKYFGMNQRTLWRYIHKHLPIISLHGEGNGNSRLTQEDIIEIRLNYIPYKNTYQKISKQFGVSRTTIERIVRRETWNHI